MMHNRAELVPGSASARAAEPSVSVLIESARVAALRGDWREAGRFWNIVRERAPDYAPAYAGSANALCRGEKYEEAELVLDAGRTQFPDHEQIAIEVAWLTNARRDWPTALARWAAFRTRFPENPWGYLGSAQALRGAGLDEQMEAMLVAAEAIIEASRWGGRDQKANERVALEIARLRGDWPAVRQLIETLIGDDPRPITGLLLALANACLHLGDLDTADSVALRALATDPGLAEALLIRERVATARGDCETALDCYRSLVGLDRGVVQWSLKLVQLLNWFGHVKEAIAELEQVCARWPDNPAVRAFIRNYGPASGLIAWSTSHAKINPGRSQSDIELRAITDKAPRAATMGRALLVENPQNDVLLAEAVGADTAVFVFTGSNDAVSMPLTVFDPFLAALNLTTIYLKDFRRLRFLTGIQSLADDYEGTVVALRALLDRLSVRRLCVIGNCDGGFAAIRYGVELGADRILTFNAPTHSPRGAPTKLEAGRNFMRNRLMANVPAHMMDLRPFLEGCQHSTKIELFYKIGDERDRVHAGHLEGLPGVRLHPQPFEKHKLLRQLALRADDFRGWLGEQLGVKVVAQGRA